MDNEKKNSLEATPATKGVAVSVRDLQISFSTDFGRVHAVRGVSFDLYKGETLCIVGESGSGKSVTSKAIMGILPGNGHIDGGQIIYEGEDLTKVSEEEFHRIRGSKIGMIFQDPLSSLNPIMRIGKQITEVMIINGNHLKRMFNDLISNELVHYKNDQQILALAKENVSIAKRVGKKVLKNSLEKAKDNYRFACSKARKEAKASNASADEKIAALTQEYQAKIAELEKTYADSLKLAHDNYVQVKAEKTPKLAEDKAALTTAKASAKAKVDAYRKQLRSEHIAKQKGNIARFFAHAPEGAKKNDYQRGVFREIILERRQYLSKIRVSQREAKERALKVMAEVGIPDPERRFNQYPFEFSGGMRQRIVIAIALTADPDVLICDEPTTALDVTIQAQILELINRLKAARHMSVIFITHDLGVVANMADRVAVMYAGKIVEYGTAIDVFYHPAHPYTWALLSSIPDVDSKERLEAIPGTPPNMLFPPKGDAFALRSKYALGIDFKKEPPLFKISDTHYAATWLLDPHAPKAVMPKIVSTRIENSLRKAGLSK